MLKKILASSSREDLRTAKQDMMAAAERLQAACVPDGYCPFIEKPDFSAVNDLRHVRNPR